MRYRFWSFFSVASICLFTFTIVSNTGTVFAAASGNNVEIVSVIEPVRYILVNKNNTIEQIQSNCQTNVVPLVYKGSYNSSPITLSPTISAQYEKIMSQINNKKTGVIYQRQTQNNLLIDLSFITRLNKYQGSID